MTTAIRFTKGTHRVVEPAETLRRAREFFTLMGITRIANITGLDYIGIPVVQVVRPNSRTNAVFQGKGTDLNAAKASAVMESIETWHAEHMLLPKRLDSLAVLKACNESTIDVERLPKVIDSKFHDQLCIDWVEGIVLSSGNAIWVPNELVSADYTLPAPEGSGCFAANTNGLASGNHILEAMNHALCELIERDARALWTFLSDSDLAETSVDLDTVEDELCRSVLECLERAAVKVAVWESTSNIGIPAFRCLLIGRDGDLIDPEMGDGCHPDPHVALVRALTEAVQARCGIISGARDDIFEAYARTARADRIGLARELMALSQPQRRLIAINRFDTLEAEHDFIVGQLRAAGMDEIVAIDLTRPEIGIPVCRAMVPGLEGLYNDLYVPGERMREARRAN